MLPVLLLSVAVLTMIGTFSGADDPDPGEDDTGDLMVGTDGQDSLYGHGGDDTLQGAGGADLLYGGAGNDDVEGGDGQDQLYGEAGNDRIATWSLSELDYYLGPDRPAASSAYGGEGDDTLYGMSAGDSLFGGDGDDDFEILASGISVEGGAGNDQTTLEVYVDDVTDDVTIKGGEGDDLLRLTGGDLRLYGDTGNDTVSAYYGDGSILDGGTGDDRLVMSGMGASCGLMGGEGNDVLISTSEGGVSNVGDGNRLNGGAGDDRIEIFYRDASTLTGGEGADSFAVWSMGYEEYPTPTGQGAITISDFDPEVDRLIMGNTGGQPMLRFEIDTVAGEVRVYTGQGEDEDHEEELALRLTGLDHFDPSWITFAPVPR